MAKRGRPKLNRPSIDIGTPELIARRAAALGPRRKDPGGQDWPIPKSEDSASALGRLLWRGYLSPTYDTAKSMFDAGEHFAALWMMVYPKTMPIGTLGRFVPGEPSEVTEEGREAAEFELKRLTTMLGKDRTILDAVLNCTVYQRLNPRQLERLKAGLSKLVEYQREQRRAA